jgi:hypothetical protein
MIIETTPDADAGQIRRLMMGDISSPRWLYAKGGSFIVLGLLASVLILLERPSLKVALLLTLAVWSFARAYYFAFYVIEHYIDSTFKFSGLWSLLRYLGARRRWNLPQDQTVR